MGAIISALLNGKTIELGIATIETARTLAALLKRPTRPTGDSRPPGDPDTEDVPLAETLKELDEAAAPFERVEDVAERELDKLDRKP